MAWYCLQSSISITEKIFCSRSPLPMHCKCHSAVRHQLHQCSHKTWNNLVKQRRMGFPNVPRMKPLYHSFPTYVAAWLAQKKVYLCRCLRPFCFPILSVQVVYSHESAATRLDKSHWTRRMEFPTIPQTLLLYHSFRGRLASTKELPLHNDPLGESAKPNSIEFDQPGKSFA